MNNKFFWWIIIPLWGVAAWLAVFNDVNLVLRFTVVFGFLMICPGKVLTYFLPISDETSQWSVSLALSVLLNAIVSLVMIYAKVWEPQYGLLLMIGLSIIGIIAQIILGSRRSVAQ